MCPCAHQGGPRELLHLCAPRTPYYGPADGTTSRRRQHHIHVVTAVIGPMPTPGTSAGDVQLQDHGIWASSGNSEPIPTATPPVTALPGWNLLQGSQHRSGCGTVAPCHPAPRSPYRLVLRQPLGDVEVIDLRGNLLPVPWLGDTNGREVLRERGESGSLSTSRWQSQDCPHGLTSGVIRLMVVMS